jgi:hypothetical protein
MRGGGGGGEGGREGEGPTFMRLNCDESSSFSCKRLVVLEDDWRMQKVAILSTSSRICSKWKYENFNLSSEEGMAGEGAGEELPPNGLKDGIFCKMDKVMEVDLAKTPAPAPARVPPPVCRFLAA